MSGQPPAPGRRVVRVFVSSTFRDMQAEREELIKRVFPRLRRMCEPRGSAWGERGSLPAGPKERRAVRRRLVEYFAGRPRVPWQLGNPVPGPAGEFGAVYWNFIKNPPAEQGAE